MSCAVLVLATACSDDGVPQGDDTDAVGTTGTASASGTTAESLATTVDPATGSDADPEAESTAGGTSGTDPTSGIVPGGSVGCGIPYGGELVVDGGIDVDGQTRTFVLSVPDGYDPSVPYPLVFAWHGRGGNGQLARLYFGVEEASADQAIFVYPDALPLASMGGATGWELVNGGSDVQFFDTLYAEMTNNLCVDLDRVFSTGHSFGGYMSNALGCFRADVLRAIAPVAGGPPLQACQSERVAAWITHGTMDGVVPFAQGQASRDSMLPRNGCADENAAVDPDPCVAYEGCDPDYPVTWCAHDIADMDGHLWPPFAADAIWGFFAALPVPASP
jgi:poly(3-hydroxybutyrate) depolymerase